MARTRQRRSRRQPRAMGMAWSSSDSASRTEPSAARAISASASSLGLDALLGADRREVLDQHAGIDAAQIEALAARQHGDRHLARSRWSRR